MLLTSSKQEKHLLIHIKLFQSKAVFMLNVSAKFEWEQINDEEGAPILILTVFYIFDTHRSKYDFIDVIVTSLLIDLQNFIKLAFIFLNKSF